MAARIVQIEGRSEPHRRRNVTAGLVRGLAALAFAAVLAPTLTACGPHAAPPPQESTGPGGPFSLVDDNGRPADQSVLKGKWSVVFFGYTFCPDFCPTTLTMLGQTMKALGPKAAQTQVVFITVDPARDTPAQLKTYLSSPVFPRNAIGLTGTPAQVARAAKAYYVYYKRDGAGADYTVDHSTALYLMDPDGRYVKAIADALPPAEVARQISEAMNGLTPS